MWKLAVLACLAVVCTAAPVDPPKPKIPETFDAKGNVMVHYSFSVSNIIPPQGNVMVRRRETFMGNGRFIRNQMKGEGVEMITVMVNKTRNETEERLERYDMGEEYLIHMNATNTRCRAEKTTMKEIPPFWGWLEMAHYVGNHTEHMLDLDFWMAHAGGGVRLLVGVGRTDADRNTPFFFAREIAESRLEMEITAFETMVPDDDLFKVPSACM